MFRLNRNERSHWSGNGVHVESELVFMIGRNMHLPDEAVNKLVARLMEDIDEEKARLLLFLFATGSRMGEARALKLQDCDLNRQIAYLPTSKSGRERLIPLNQFALELIRLQLQRHSTTGLLFRGQDCVSPISEPRRYWYRVCNDCGLSEVRIHDARHTVATSLLNKGCSLDVLQKVLGRVRISTLHNETEKISLLNSNTYKGAFLCLVTYSHLP